MTLTPELERDFAAMRKYINDRSNGSWWNDPRAIELLGFDNDGALARIRTALEEAQEKVDAWEWLNGPECTPQVLARYRSRK